MIDQQARRQVALGRLSNMHESRSRYGAMMMQRAEQRYDDYKREMRRREEEARRRQSGSWLGNAMKGGIGGAITGLVGSGFNPIGGLAGFGAGALAGGIAKGTGTQDFMYGTLLPMASQAAGTYAMGQMYGGGPGGGGYGMTPPGGTYVPGGTISRSTRTLFDPYMRPGSGQFGPGTMFS